MNNRTKPINRIIPVKLLMFAGLAFALPLAFAQSKENSEAAFVKQKDSVFLINQSIFVDARQIGDTDLFKKLETAMGRKVLDQYIPLVNGTGFLINKDGYLMTAAHVVTFLPKDKKEEYGYWSFLNFCTKYMLPGKITSMEFRYIVTAYKRLVKAADVFISVTSTKGKVYRAAIVNQDDGLDLALLKIEINEELAPFSVGDSSSLQVGDSVVSIGYPLQFTMDEFLEDFKPTVTNGIISAIRTDKWDIQHTAATNPGNSGGPLLSKDGTVIGVVVGTVTGANALHFATSSNKITNWLSSLGKKDLLTVEGDK
jgi:S1-C subfamily serine protease